MTDPKIRYDILANAEGEEDVRRLSAALQEVDEALDPVAAKRAQELSSSLQQLGQQQAALETFRRLKTESADARVALDQAQAAAQKLAQELTATAAPTRAQAGQLEKLKDAVRAAKTEVQAKGQALDVVRGQLSAFGIATGQAAAAQQRIKTEMQAVRAEGAQLVTRYRETATAATASAGTQAAAQRQLGEGFKSLGQQLGDLQRLAAVAVGGTVLTQLAGDAARTADTYSNLAARIKLVTGEGESFDSAFEGVFDVATRTNSALESTGALFTKIAAAGAPIGVLQRDALALTESINQAVQLSGTAAQASDAAIVQLIQGLQSGVLRGEEFNSVMEQAPRLAQALADGLGVTTGELRKLAEQGTLTSDVVIRALQGQAQTLQEEFESLPPTVGRAIQNLSTEWTRYVGEVDQANGISAGAAKAIGLLAENLETLASTLVTVGEAYLAYKALELAASYTRQAAAIQVLNGAVAREAVTRSLATEATVANTAATTANTAATTANATAKTASAVANAAVAASEAEATAKRAVTIGVAGKLAGALGLAATAALLFGDVIAKVFTATGAFIGEGIAKLQGFKDRSSEVAAEQELLEKVTRQQAAAQAAQNQQLQQAEERALGLTLASKKLVGEFEAMERKGESTAASLEKLTKNLALGDITGIQDAVTALDVLAERGKITADQVREALATALKGVDLESFETQAGAAFDTSEQGARRLKAALLAVDEEALRRVGTSTRELQSGFSAAATSAINDVDKLARALTNLRVPSEDASRLLSAALDKATDAASTDTAVRAVIERLVELGKQGRVAGDDLSGALDKARKKLDELKPGVTSLNEALRTFGLKTREELQATADKLGAAYKVLANDVTVSLADKVRAFNQYRDAAIAANGGVEGSQLKLEAAILKSKTAAGTLGSTIVESMKAARRATDDAAESQEKAYLKFLQSDPSRLVGGAGGGVGITNSGIGNGGAPAISNGNKPASAGTMSAGGTKYDDQGFAIGVGGSFQVPVPEGYYYTMDPYAPGAFSAGTAPNGQPYGGYLAPILRAAGPAPAPAAAPQAQTSNSSSTSSRTVTLNLSVGGRTFPVASDEATADALLAQIERDRFAAGG